MEQFIIAGLKTEYEVQGELLRSRSKGYKASFDSAEAQISFRIKKEFLQKKQQELPHLSADEHEYMWTGEAFYNELIKHNGMMLHSSCVEKDGQAYLFSARSGTGKSTHTHLWLENLSGTRIINDDKPALVCEDGKWYVWGTPFSGKTDENVNVKIPVRAIIFLHRSEENKVEKLSPARSVGLLLEQTINPVNREMAEKMLDLVDMLLRRVPTFSLGCNMDPQAAVIAYSEIERIINNED
ncbi:MAG: hypothetical protein J6B37_01900 [Clostridia bacterium]|nr:hypothetical protein [Clostridia bacterium]